MVDQAKPNILLTLRRALTVLLRRALTILLRKALTVLHANYSSYAYMHAHIMNISIKDFHQGFIILALGHCFPVTTQSK